MTLKDYAIKHGLSVDKVVQAKNDWLCSEGYDGEGEEYSLMEWLDTFCARVSPPQNWRRYETREPYDEFDFDRSF